jgi:hypothetical protein
MCPQPEFLKAVSQWALKLDWPFLTAGRFFRGGKRGAAPAIAIHGPSRARPIASLLNLRRVGLYGQNRQ